MPLNLHLSVPESSCSSWLRSWQNKATLLTLQLMELSRTHRLRRLWALRHFQIPPLHNIAWTRCQVLSSYTSSLCLAGKFWLLRYTDAISTNYTGDIFRSMQLEPCGEGRSWRLLVLFTWDDPIVQDAIEFPYRDLTDWCQEGNEGRNRRWLVKEIIYICEVGCVALCMYTKRSEAGPIPFTTEMILSLWHYNWIQI